METIKAKLIKIMRLAESPVPGEREAAKRFLHELCGKYHIHPDSLLSPEMDLRRFKHRGGKDLVLLVLCMRTIISDWRNRLGRSTRRYIDVVTTKAEALDIIDMIRHYRKALRQDTKDFFIAFINRHDLVSDDGKPVENIDPERLQRLLSFMRGIQSDTWVRPKARLNQTGALLGLSAPSAGRIIKK